MPAGLTLWTHALAALLFGALALAQTRAPGGGLSRAAFVAALGATALWALAVAGIGPGDVSARLAEGIRNLAWLGVLFSLVRRDHATALRGAVSGAYLAVAGVTIATMLLAAIAAFAPDASEVRSTLIALEMLATIGRLVLLRHLFHGAASRARGGVRMIALAVGLLWSIDLVLYAAMWLTGGLSQPLVIARGAAVAALAPLFGIAVQRGGEWRLQISRTIAYQALTIVALAGWAIATAVATGLIAEFGGGHARLFQTAFVLGTTTAMLTVLSTPWLRATAKVLVAKHLFSHRYDYRAEWRRFTDTLGEPGSTADPLETRVVKAVADLTSSPKGLLFTLDGRALEPVAHWMWDGGSSGADEAFAQHLETTRRTVELDAVRAGRAPAAETASTPAWLVADMQAWAVVPLIHFDRLVGAIVLARPPVDRALDWEDFDLLGIAGRQAASYLAEDRAHVALAQAERFEEFNRRFAFILHDLKNLVSQLSLVARNAERHADNAEFRADMVETLRESSARMTTLLARLSQRTEPRRSMPVALFATDLIDRVARMRRTQHPVTAEGDDDAWVVGDPAALETMVGNLVQNAIEASGAGSTVRLEARRIADQVILTVTDTGCGMSASFVRDRLFAPFASTKGGGFGLGAYEARQIAEAQSGRLTVVSRENAGTTFTIALPAAADAMMEQAA